MLPELKALWEIWSAVWLLENGSETENTLLSSLHSNTWYAKHLNSLK